MRATTLLLGLLGLLLAVNTARAQDFPVTIEHALGSTTVPEAPRRVVSIGYVEQDFLYALGIAPVGVRNWWGEHPYATWPWAQAAREAVGATPEVMPGDEINLEWVLNQNPDLIIAVYLDLDEPTYAALSKIAPVIANPKGYPLWGAPWQVELQVIDRATSGSTAKADAIIAGIDAKVADIRAKYPELEGKTGTNVYYNASEGNFIAWGPEDTASRFITGFGLVFPTELAAMGDRDNRIRISPENLALLDLDLIVWPIDSPGDLIKETVEAMPLYQNLRLAKEGRSIWLDDGHGTFSGALSFQSPLSIGYLLDTMPPMLAAAADGDPATLVEVPCTP
jgi:iron complex transport system substrate-binding protein